MTALLILAAIVDTLLAVLLLWVSGFVFGGGPEGSGGDLSSVAAWSGALAACIGSPVAGFILRAHQRIGNFAALLTRFIYLPRIGDGVLPTSAESKLLALSMTNIPALP